MAYIDIISEADASGSLAELYKRFGNPDGTVDNVLKVHSLNPESLDAHCALYVQSMHRPSPLSRAERELVGVVVSMINGCAYCQQHHASGLRRLLPKDREPLVDKLLTQNIELLTDREQAMVAYAEHLTRAPDSIEADHVQGLRHAGLSDREILDLAQVVAYFNYANRIVLGLGAEIESGEGPIGQWPESK